MHGRTDGGVDLRSRASIVVVVLVIETMLAACTDRSNPSARLRRLGELWLRTPATVVYATTVRASGGAVSTHQCLRQYAGGTVDRQSAIAICSGSGAMTLVWDPPERWRLEASSPSGSFVEVVTPDGARICRGPATSRCRVASVDAARSAPPFALVLTAPGRVLGDGAPVMLEPDRTIAGLRAECFSANVDPPEAGSRVQWCFSPGGVLLYLSDERVDGAVTTVEATSVVPRVSATSTT